MRESDMSRLEFHEGPGVRPPRAVVDFLYSVNPWWEGKPGRIVPPYKRWAFTVAHRRLQTGLASALVLRGPRQVGKTTLQEQIIDHLLQRERVPASHILRVQFDDIPSLKHVPDPILTIARWFEIQILRKTFNEAARSAAGPAYLFLDEVQNLDDWAPQLKALVDHHSVRALVTGSSALRIELGRDSLAGRVSQIDLGTLLLREVAGLRFNENINPPLPPNGLEALLLKEFWEELRQLGTHHRTLRDRAFAAFSERGGYPLAQGRAEVPWPELADQLNETVIRRAIRHDLRLGARGQKRDEQLLEEVFRLACRYAGQAPGQAVLLNQIQQALHANVGWQRILTYLRFLDGTLLLRLIQPLEIRLKKRRGNHKLCLCDHGLRASWLQEVVPLHPEGLRTTPHLTDLAGHLAESVVGYFLASTPGLEVAHFPERGSEPEVDFVITVGERRIPMEVKYRQHIDAHRDTVGLRAFLEKTVYNAPFGILVTLHDEAPVADPRIVCIPLSSLLFMR